MTEHGAAPYEDDLLSELASEKALVSRLTDAATEDVAEITKLLEQNKRLRAALAKSCDETRYEDFDAGCPRAKQAEAKVAGLRAALEDALVALATIGEDGCRTVLRKALVEQKE